MLKIKKGKNMKEDKEKFFILPDKNKNSEESLKETVDYYRKVQKKLTKFLSVIPFPVAGIIVIILLASSIYSGKTTDIILSGIAAILCSITFIGSRKIAKMDLMEIGDIELRKAVNIFNANAPYISTENGKRKLKINYELLKKIRNKK